MRSPAKNSDGSITVGPMLLFKRAFWDGLTRGDITLTFRRWQTLRVRKGGRYRCHPIGVLEVDDVRWVKASAITAADAKRAGFASKPELLAHLGELGPIEPDTEVVRVELHHGGDGDRVELALEDQLTPDDVVAIRGALERMDRKAPWTAATFAIIDAHPRVAASKLAAMLGRETLPFKTDVRKLKRLGLTQSFEVGYEIAPRGRAYLAAVAEVAAPTSTTKPVRKPPRGPKRRA